MKPRTCGSGGWRLLEANLQSETACSIYCSCDRPHEDAVTQGIGGPQAGEEIPGRAESGHPGPDSLVVQAAR
jgi:hypothetical protein